MMDETINELLGRDDSSVITIPNNQIWYTSTDGKIVYPCNPQAFNVAIESYKSHNGYFIITFKGDLTEIGDFAFWFCDRLESVILPNSLTTIGRGAFLGCSDLKEFKGKFASNDGRVLIVDKVLKSVAPAAGLTEYTIPDIVTTIGDYAFYECSSLTSVTIPDSVTTIGDAAFCVCSSLTSVTIPDSVTTIGYQTFWCCSSITSVTIPDSVTTIGYDAFYGCSSLTSITIPDSVTSIGESAFAYCGSLTEFRGKYASEDGRYLIIDGTLNSFAPAGLTEYTIPDGVTTIGEDAFAYCDRLTSITIPDSVTTIGQWAFGGCSSLKSVTIGDSVTTIGETAFGECSSLTSVTLPDSVTTIRSCAFSGCSSLTSITIPDSVTTIGEWAFGGCSSLTSVYCKAITPPAGGSDMFFNNASGRMIYVPAESVEAYKSAEWWRAYAYAIVADSSILEDLPTSIIRYTTADGDVVTPQNMSVKSNTYIDGEGVLEFYGDAIGESAFFACNNLRSVIIGDSVTQIGDFAFNACEAITSVTLGKSVEYIGFKAFDDCIGITEITIPDSVQTIGVQAFCYCTSLSSFKGKFASEDGKCLIVDGKLIAFAIGCEDVGEYVIPDGVTDITNYSVYFCQSLSSVVIPESVITIGEGAFKDCRNLNSVTIGDNVRCIEDYAFYLCGGLTSVYCKPTVPPLCGTVDYCAAFACNASGRKIYVPMESVEVYKSAEGWWNYANSIVGYDF